MKEKPSVLQVLVRSILGLVIGIVLIGLCFEVVSDLVGKWLHDGVSFWVLFQTCMTLILSACFLAGAMGFLISVYHGLFHGEWYIIESTGNGGADPDIRT